MLTVNVCEHDGSPILKLARDVRLNGKTRSRFRVLPLLCRVTADYLPLLRAGYSDRQSPLKDTASRKRQAKQFELQRVREDSRQRRCNPTGPLTMVDSPHWTSNTPIDPGWYWYRGRLHRRWVFRTARGSLWGKA